MKKWIVIFFVGLTACSGNLLKETADTKSQDAIYYQAKLKLSESDYNTAILLFQQLDPSYLANREVSMFYASAYSGRCGLNFINLIGKLSSVSGTIFHYIMGLYPNSTDTKITDCETAESTVSGIGTSTQRTDDENILMGLSSITKIGTILNRYADTDNDGAADAGFDQCDTTDFPDAAVRELGTGIANAVLSITAASASFSTGALTDITAACALDPNLNSFCTTTDPNAFTANEIKVLRSLIGTTTYGIGSCSGGLLACFCP